MSRSKGDGCHIRSLLPLTPYASRGQHWPKALCPADAYQFVAQNGAVLAVAAEAFEDRDDIGFGFVARNFGPPEATEVLVVEI
jgi:hypothetical protein